MGFRNTIVKLDSEAEEILDRAINKENRNILIIGRIGSGKSVVLRHITSICRNNRNIIDGESGINVRKVLEENSFNNSMSVLGGGKTTAILDEFPRLTDGYDLLFRENRQLYSNYIMSAHCGSDMTLSEVKIPKELISWLNPIILKTVREREERAYTIEKTYTIEITDSGKELYKGIVYGQI